ncbi:unnamed protein product [Lactuca virosa]|uniref:Uncharacterized protein n=1 Tax=Lactuca virosa TaxID=75947 RepID=A0AAU9M972_9ASTR|nr:unnamed protein product [Lactuca virosa]
MHYYLQRQNIFIGKSFRKNASGMLLLVTQSSRLLGNKRPKKDIDSGKAPPTHNGGSASHQQIAADMEEYTGKAPSCYELFMFTHTKDHDGKTIQVDKAKEVHDLFVSQRADLALLGEEVPESELFYTTVGGHDRKKKFMGLDHMGGPFFVKTPLKHALHRIKVLKNIISRRRCRN